MQDVKKVFTEGGGEEGRGGGGASGVGSYRERGAKGGGRGRRGSKEKSLRQRLPGKGVGSRGMQEHLKGGVERERCKGAVSTGRSQG